MGKQEKEIILNLSLKRDDKAIQLYYSAEAWIKIQALLQAHQLEIGWNMVVKPYKEGYKITDVLVYPQKVSAAFIAVDTAKYGLWKDELTAEQDKNLFGQAHSHVNMSCAPSPRDLQNQFDELVMKKSGFYLFQIFNKKGVVWTRLYDLDKEKYYTKTEIEIEADDVSMTEFIEDSFSKLAKEKLNEPEQVV